MVYRSVVVLIISVWLLVEYCSHFLVRFRLETTTFDSYPLTLTKVVLIKEEGILKEINKRSQL